MVSKARKLRNAIEALESDIAACENGVDPTAVGRDDRLADDPAGHKRLCERLRNDRREELNAHVNARLEAFFDRRDGDGDGDNTTASINAARFEGDNTTSDTDIGSMMAHL